MILVLLGGTCSGKTEFSFCCESFGIPKVITNTTRARRVDDTDNAYNFLSESEFIDKLNQGKILEYTKYNGNYYGTDIDSFSKNCVVVLDPNGYRALKKIKPTEVYSILLDVSPSERLNRGRIRGDTEESLLSRIEVDNSLFTDKLRSEVSFVLCDLKREDIPIVIASNLDTFLGNN